MFSHIRSIYKRYTLQELANHPAIVILPYAVMSYSIVEFYAINLPMFVPSIEFLYELNVVEDRTLQSHYCENLPDTITFNKQKNVNISSHAYSPNSEEYSAFSYWLQYADYYQWPFVTVFDSYEDLFTKLKNVDLKRISEKMKQHNLVKEADLLNNWCRLTKSMPKVQDIPESYEKALAYFGVDNF